MLVCPQCSEENLDRARFCLACGTQLQAEAPARRESRKTVSIVFADVVQSTQLAEALDPERFRNVMTRYFSEMRSVLVRHGGRVEKFIGDAVMAAFGVPMLHEDDALRAVRAAFEMSKALDVLNEELRSRWGIAIQMRIGVNTGEVVAGNEAASQALLAGDAVVVAARLQQVAEPDEILVGEATYKLVKDFVDAELAEPRPVKGKEHPPVAYVLHSVRAEQPLSPRAIRTPLIGRAEEADKLRSVHKRAVAESGCRLVTVVGWPGIGKSRLVREFVDSLGGHARVYKGRCLSYGQGITFWPVTEVVHQAAGLTVDPSLDEVLTKLALLVEGDPRAALIADRVAQIAGFSSASTPMVETFWALRALLERLAADLPLVLVFEDIHWAEATFLDLVEYLAAAVVTVPITIVCTARPELFDVRSDWPKGIADAGSIELDRLTDEESGSMIDTLLGAHFPADVTDRIRQAAEGNPLYIEQMISSLHDEGYLEGSTPAGRDLTTVTIPPTVNALIAARLDRLADEERAVIEGASVIGKEFSLSSLQTVCPEEIRPQLDVYVDSLVRKQMHEVRQSGEGNFRFHHALIRDSAYNSMPKKTRGALHEALSTWMLNVATDRESQFEELIGFHLEQASRYFMELEPLGGRAENLARDAARLLATAGRRAFAREDLPTAISHLRRAAALLPHDDPDRAAFLPELAEALKEAGDFEETRTVVADAERAVPPGEIRVTSRLRLVSLDLDFRVDAARKTAQGRDELHDLIESLESVGDNQGLAKAWNLLGHLQWWRGQFGAMADAALNAIDCARKAGDEREETWAHANLAISTAMGPTPVEHAIQLCERIRSGFKDNRMLEARTLMALGLLKGWSGDFAAARAAVETARSIHDDMGLKLRAATDLPQLAGAIELLAGNPAAAEEILRRGREVIEEMGEKVYVPVLMVRLGQAVYAQGRYDEAEALAHEVTQGGEADSVFLQVWSRTLRAKVLARRGDPEGAQALAQEAVAIAERTDHLSLHGDALVDLAETMLVAGRPRDATRPLEEALALYERKGNVVGTRVVRLLFELDGGDPVTDS